MKETHKANRSTPFLAIRFLVGVLYLMTGGFIGTTLVLVIAGMNLGINPFMGDNIFFPIGAVLVFPLHYLKKYMDRK
jgi:hypothetical protein